MPGKQKQNKSKESFFYSKEKFKRGYEKKKKKRLDVSDFNNLI